MTYDYKSYDAWSMTNGYDQYPVTDPLPSPTDIELSYLIFVPELTINYITDIIDCIMLP